jgi:hypothetical protein
MARVISALQNVISALRNVISALQNVGELPQTRENVQMKMCKYANMQICKFGNENVQMCK